MDILIGIDDTDNLESCGTGFRARMLGAALAKNGLLGWLTLKALRRAGFFAYLAERR